MKFVAQALHLISLLSVIVHSVQAKGHLMQIFVPIVALKYS
jgi:hypothetical protein